MLREKAGLSVDELAEKSGIPRTTLYDWESNKKIAGIDRLPQVAHHARIHGKLEKIKAVCDQKLRFHNIGAKVIRRLNTPRSDIPNFLRLIYSYRNKWGGNTASMQKAKKTNRVQGLSNIFPGSSDNLDFSGWLRLRHSLLHFPPGEGNAKRSFIPRTIPPRNGIRLALL